MPDSTNQNSYENRLSGFTAENKEAYTTQTSVTNSGYMKRNTKDYNDLSYFISGIDVTQQNLDQLTPYIPGVARLFMHRTPLFMEVGFPNLTRNFKSYIETGYKSVSGIDSLQADFTAIDGGFAAQSFENISKVTDGSNTITVELWEQTGSPVREYIETWMTGVRDPRSGIAHYHGLVETPNNSTGGSRVPYAEKNHTAEFVYYTLDPTAHYIEYACMWAHCFPKEVPKDHLNYASGNRDAVSMSIPFSGTKYESRYINDLAIYYLIADQLEYNYLNFNPDVSGLDANDIDYRLKLNTEKSGQVQA